MIKVIIETSGSDGVVGVYSDSPDVEYIAIDTAIMYEDTVAQVKENLKRRGITQYVERKDKEWFIKTKDLYTAEEMR